MDEVSLPFYPVYLLTMKKTLAWGLMGLGRIAYPFADALKHTQSRIVSCASLDAKRLDTFATTYAVPHRYNNYQSLYRDPNVDIIYIATPHHIHFEQMMDILDHGKHILCEKSFTLNFAEALKVFTKAKEKNLFVMEGLWSHFLPTWQKVESLVKNNVIGDITSLNLSLTFDGRQRDQKRLFSRELGGGALLDLGVYVLNFTYRMLGQPIGVKGTLGFKDHEVDVDDIIELLYPGTQTKLEVSLTKQDPRDNWIRGTKGSIYVKEFHRAQSYTLFDQNHQVIETVTHPHPCNGFEYEILHVEEMIRQGLIDSTIHPSVTTMKILKMMDKLRKDQDFYWLTEPH
jgi:predicted dehydrogenase